MLKNTSLLFSSLATLSVIIATLNPKPSANAALLIKLSDKSPLKAFAVADGKLVDSMAVFVAFSILSIKAVSAVSERPSASEQEVKNTTDKINRLKVKNKILDFEMFSFEIVVFIINKIFKLHLLLFT
jgi:hypothetical protein